MSYECVVYDVVDQVGLLTINRPKSLNSLDKQTLHEIRSVVREVDRDIEVRALVITGSGDKAFVAGADIGTMCECDPIEILEFAKTGHKTFNMLELLPKPVLAAVNGFALGGGMELALACDMIFASENARFGQPEVKLGIIPGFGGTQRLSRLVGRNVAKELIFTGETVNAHRAQEMGLVNGVFPKEKLCDAVMQIARKIKSVGALAVADAKKVINDGIQVSLEEGLKMEQTVFSGLFGTQDQREGMKAFLEKRPPSFTGKVRGHLLLS